MTTIEKILGVKPTDEEVTEEFCRRNLTMAGFDEEIVKKDNQYHIHGNYSTQSDTPEIASQKMLIVYDELGC